MGLAADDVEMLDPMAEATRSRLSMFGFAGCCVISFTRAPPRRPLFQTVEERCPIPGPRDMLSGLAGAAR
jgi:hypothetical protein